MHSVSGFHHTYILQLRCAGVLEAVRVSRLGYPQRYDHASFVSRYKLLHPSSLYVVDLNDHCQQLVDFLTAHVLNNVSERWVQILGFVYEIRWTLSSLIFECLFGRRFSFVFFLALWILKSNLIETKCYGFYRWRRIH